MKSYVARAIQISCLTQDQLDRLHERERLCKFLIPNWNIQDLFNLGTLKDKYNHPSEYELLLQHGARIEKELKDKGFLKVGSYHEDSMDWMHAVDKKVVERAFEIMWDYSGPSNRRGKGFMKALETLTCFL